MCIRKTLILVSCLVSSLLTTNPSFAAGRSGGGNFWTCQYNGPATAVVAECQPPIPPGTPGWTIENTYTTPTPYPTMDAAMQACETYIQSQINANSPC